MANNEMKAHLGDGVYVKFDGYKIVIAVNHHDNDAVVLEPEIATALIEFIKRTKE